MRVIKENIKYFFIAALLIIAVFIWYAAFRIASRQYLTVAFLDVGQGDAIFVQTPSGNQMLIDGGPNKKVISELGKVMPFWDRAIDAVLLTHPHEDHVGGLIEVLDRYDIGMIIESGAKADTGVYREWQKARNEERAQYTEALRGQRILLDRGIYLDILYPTKDAILSDDPHARMIVGKLTYDNTCFIFTGDAEREIEYKLLNDGVDCEVLKAGHHGSDTSTSDAFLQAVSPAVAVISAGKGNKYGHPHRAIIEKLTKNKIPFFRTDENSSIIFYSDGAAIWRGGE